MLKLSSVNLLFFVFAITFSKFSAAQNSADTTAYGHSLYAGVENSFYKAVGPQSRLYDGVRYEFYNPAIKGNAYLLDNSQWSKGEVLYDGFWYKNIDLLYDLYQDKLVTPLYNSFLKFSLISDKVSTFHLLGHQFIYIKPNKTDVNQPNKGYYDLLYGGKIKLLCKREKSIQEVHNFSGSIDSYFAPSLNYYLYKNGRYYTVNGKGEFLDALKDKKKDLQQFINANKIKIKKDNKEEAMVKIADYYDHLNN